MMTLKKALQNYLEDLKYNATMGGSEQVNVMSNGTPYFDTDKEMETYMDAIASLIKGETK